MGAARIKSRGPVMAQEYVFLGETTLDEYYTADAFVVRCFDDRFRQVFNNFLDSRGLKHIDCESVAGGVKVLASPEEEGDRDFIFRELEKSIRLHGAKNVWIFSHSDWGHMAACRVFKAIQEPN